MESEIVESQGMYVMQEGRKVLSAEGSRFLTRVYGWMGLALVVSAVSALFSATNVMMLRFLYATRFGFIAVILAELALVFVIGSRIRTMSTAVASVLFVLYSALNGITLSSIFLVYQLGSIVSVFAITAAMFAVMSVYGAVTKRSLGTMGNYLMMALIGVIIASLVNALLLKSSMMDYIISIVGVLIFTGLTAWDTQKVMGTAQQADGREAYRRVAIIGAFELYLDFVNLFLYMLRLLGKRR